MLEVQHLDVNYRGLQGLENVSFRVEPGQLVGVIGPNGAGKSTMFKAMLGLIPIANGHVKYCTCPLCRQLKRVAYLPQRSQIDWDFPITVWNVVMMARTRYLGWFRHPKGIDGEKVRAALERVEMFSLSSRRIGELSGGQQQRVFLARALAQQAEIFLLDEPFTGVDRKTELIMLDVFAQLKEEGKILLVSIHDWGQTMAQLDRLLLLNRSLIADGTPQQVMTPENLQRAYGMKIHKSPLPNWDANLFC